ncbi:MAG: hypothetical protein ACLP7Q_03620 [Isosphaeraceae bacterium]
MADQTESVSTNISSPGASASLGNVSVRTGIAIELTPEANQALDELMQRTGDSLSDLFRKAIGLYKLAEEAKREGKAVGIATTPDSLETEFVGL